jgi:hypothetical protein
MIMENFEFSNFKKNVERNLLDARGIAEKIQTYVDLSETDELEDDDILTFNQLTFKYNIETAILKIKCALEFLKLDKLYDTFDKKINEFKGKYDKTEYIPYIDVITNPVIDLLQNYIDVICIQLNQDEIKESTKLEQVILLERILKGTPKIIKDHQLDPKNETIIKAEVYKHLIHVFPDTIKELSIFKSFKTFKPDLGIKSLKIAIEYKFADSIQDLKTCIDGIYTDLIGYDGSEDWTNFYAVIYQTDHFMTDDQIFQELDFKKLKHNWKLILVHGRGSRNPKLIA